MTAAAMQILRCLSVHNETAGIKTFVFAPETGRPIDFAAGQAMTLALRIDADRLMRTFSIASAPGGDTIELTIKAHAGGRVTSWMHDNIGPGTLVEASGPRGNFVLGSGLERVAFISAGSGATPLMAMLRSMTGSDQDVVWFHAARNPDDILFAGGLAAMQRQMPRLRVAVSVSRPTPGWFGYTGRVSRRLLSTAIPDLTGREVFCCGPSGFMDAVKLAHAAEGGRTERFHIEHFHAPTPLLPVPAVATSGSAAIPFRITLQNGKSFEATADETILEAATRQTVVIPCGCASGLCGTCRVHKVSGDVMMRHNGGLSPEEEAENYILACSSRPLSDVTIAL